MLVRVALDPEEDAGALLQRLQDQAVSMTPFEQIGLQFIGRLRGDAERACRFQTLMVVQPTGRGQREAHPLFVRDEVGQEAKGLDAMNTYALTLECELQSDG